MRPLTERVLDALALKPGGLSVTAAAKACNESGRLILKAFEAIASAGSGTLVRRGRSVCLAAPGIVDHVCVMCQREFERAKKSRRETCSKRCAIAYGWVKDPERAERRRTAISKSKQTPEAMALLAAHNKRRWAKSSERKKLSDQNKREWKDPEKAAVRAAKIRLNHATEEYKAHASKKRKEAWERSDTRERMTKAMTATMNTPEYKAKFSKALSERWKDPVMREKYTRANHNRNSPEARAKNAARLKALWADPEWAAAQRARIKSAREERT